MICLVYFVAVHVNFDYLVISRLQFLTMRTTIQESRFLHSSLNRKEKIDVIMNMKMTNT